MNKLIVILGPTASGKSALAINLATKFNGEVISADSRQVYRGLDIGSGKVSQQERRKVRHHLLDVASPKKQFTVSDFKKLGHKAVATIEKKNKLPFIVGGTAFYIYSLIDDWNIPEVKPNLKLRKTLEKKSLDDLLHILKKLDPDRVINIDHRNPARLIRAIEIIKSTGQPVPKFSQTFHPNPGVLILGIKQSQEHLYQLIDKRLTTRLPGIIKEIKNLRKSGVSWKRLEQFGLEYRFVSYFLTKKLDYDSMVNQLQHAIHHFAKRQMTWFKRDRRIHWITTPDQAQGLIRNFLTHK